MTKEFKCLYCGAPSAIDPSDQWPPAGYCHAEDHEQDTFDPKAFDHFPTLGNLDAGLPNHFDQSKRGFDPK